MALVTAEQAVDLRVPQIFLALLTGILAFLLLEAFTTVCGKALVIRAFRALRHISVGIVAFPLCLTLSLALSPIPVLLPLAHHDTPLLGLTSE